MAQFLFFDDIDRIVDYGSELLLTRVSQIILIECFSGTRCTEATGNDHENIRVTEEAMIYESPGYPDIPMPAEISSLNHETKGDPNDMGVYFNYAAEDPHTIVPPEKNVHLIIGYALYTAVLTNTDIGPLFKVLKNLNKEILRPTPRMRKSGNMSVSLLHHFLNIFSFIPFLKYFF